MDAHDAGAVIFFVVGNLYAWCQVIISYHMRKFHLVSTTLCVVRTVVSVISTASLFIFLILKFYSQKLWHGDIFYWNSNDPGYKLHVIGNAFEWILVLHFLILILTFAKELHRRRLEINLVRFPYDYEPIPVS